MKYMLLLLLLLAGLCGLSQPVKKISINDLEQYIAAAEKPLVINFWATFCKPCIEEIPHFLEAAEGNKDVELVLVSLDLPDFYPRYVTEFLQKKKFLAGATHFWLNETNADSFCPRIDSSWEGAMPVTLFVNKRTQFRRFVGSPMTQAQIVQAFRELR